MYDSDAEAEADIDMIHNEGLKSLLFLKFELKQWILSISALFAITKQ